MQPDQKRLTLKAASRRPVLMVKKKSGYRIIKVNTNSMKNHVFQIGANINLIVFKGVKILILDISYKI